MAFVEQNPQVLCPLSIALLGEITNHNPPRLTNIGKEVVMHDHIQSKIMAHQFKVTLSVHHQKSKYQYPGPRLIIPWTT